MKLSFAFMALMLGLCDFASVLTHAENANAATEEYLVCKPMSKIFTEDDKRTNCSSPTSQGPPGIKGERGPPGPVASSNVSRLQELERKLQEIETRQILKTSCEEIKRAAPESQNGIYYIRDANGVEYPVFCDMATHGGGWTLVASIHENNLGTSGRCTAGDRWSSEQGNSAAHPNGDGNWENRNLFGHVTAAASDDYKNAAYFELQASDLMVLHVPNDTPPSLFVDDSTFQYRTTEGVLTPYGGNLHELFKQYPIRANVYTKSVDNGPSFPVEFDKGSALQLLMQLGAGARRESEAGYIQFRTINYERGAFAFCPGIRIRPNEGNVEHMCVGGSSLQGDVKYCGDFSSLDYYSSGAGHAYGSSEARKQTVFMIFYR